MFTTAFSSHAFEAFETGAIDYLLKPFSAERFDAALAAARAAVQPAGRVAAVLRDVRRDAGPLERVLIRDGARVHVLATTEIEVIEAQDDYIEISAGGRRWLKQQRLADLEAQLDPARFVRVHRSWIVNLGKMLRIETLAKDSHVCVMVDGRHVPVSRSGQHKLRERLV